MVFESPAIIITYTCICKCSELVTCFSPTAMLARSLTTFCFHLFGQHIFLLQNGNFTCLHLLMPMSTLCRLQSSITSNMTAKTKLNIQLASTDTWNSTYSDIQFNLYLQRLESDSDFSSDDELRPIFKKRKVQAILLSESDSDLVVSNRESNPLVLSDETDEWESDISAEVCRYFWRRRKH